ncbi:hypothetical protein [Ornithinimicrobium kibberense]|uniref:hypothetical protein n=1 Tax=Ornithinimicrobium kibberense TaxID=282060 RepID=UPI00361C80E8
MRQRGSLTVRPTLGCAVRSPVWTAGSMSLSEIAPTTEGGEGRPLGDGSSPEAREERSLNAASRSGSSATRIKM